MTEPYYSECAVNPWASLDPAAHCFREDNCPHHEAHTGPLCCCCKNLAEAHAGCDCD